MSYYTLPKKKIEFKIKPTFNNEITPFISNSLFTYIQELQSHLDTISIQDPFTMDISYNELNVQFLNKMINQYEFIFFKVPDTQISVSKLKPFSNTFYVFMEINSLFDILDYFQNTNIRIMCYGKNSTSIIECINMFRENYNDISWTQDYINFNNIKQFGVVKSEDIEGSSIDFLYYELQDHDYLHTKNYINGFIFILCNMLYYQSENGITVIKIHDVFYKPIIDVLYILSSLYDKVYIIKPNITNVISGERYLVCKNFVLNVQKVGVYNKYIHSLNALLMINNYEIYENYNSSENYEKCESSTIISSLIDEPLPVYLLSKLEEINIIIGHQQIDYIDQLISLIKSKNTDKIEKIKKHNIQKCVQWCEKYKIPHNKFTDKVNIFLPSYFPSLASTSLSCKYIQNDTEFLLHN